MAFQQIAGAALLAGGTALGAHGAGQRDLALSSALGQGRQEQQRVSQGIEGLDAQQLGALQQLQAQRRGALESAMSQFQNQDGGEAAGQLQAARQQVASGAPTFQQPGGAAAQQAQAEVAQRLAPQQGALQQLAEQQLANQQIATGQQGALQQLARTDSGLRGEANTLARTHQLPQAQLSLEQMLNQMETQRNLQQANQAGGNAMAFGGLAQQVGGSLLGGGFGGLKGQ